MRRAVVTTLDAFFAEVEPRTNFLFSIHCFTTSVAQVQRTHGNKSLAVRCRNVLDAVVSLENRKVQSVIALLEHQVLVRDGHFCTSMPLASCSARSTSVRISSSDLSISASKTLRP